MNVSQKHCWSPVGFNTKSYYLNSIVAHDICLSVIVRQKSISMLKIEGANNTWLKNLYNWLTEACKALSTNRISEDCVQKYCWAILLSFLFFMALLWRDWDQPVAKTANPCSSFDTPRQPLESWRSEQKCFSFRGGKS